MDEKRIYLDNAATSWPKPDVVYDAVDQYLRSNGAPAGRSVYVEAQDVERRVQETRNLAARLLGGVAPANIVFTCNGTDSLNLAIHGLVRPGDHVVTTLLEHNSVLRPLRYLERHADVEVTRVGCGADTLVDPDEVWRAVRPTTRLIVWTHMSNVTGARQQVSAVCRQAAERDLPCLIDAAQSLGHEPVEFAALPTTLVAAPAHKGLLGPLGLGILTIPDQLVERLRPIRQGGTGTSSERDTQPESLPDRYESGNHNVPGILGLCEGLRWLLEQDRDTLRGELALRSRELRDGLDRLDNVRVFGPPSEFQGPVVSFLVDGFGPQEVAAMLDSAHRIQARAGYLCAPKVHELIGASEEGVVRFSPGCFTTAEDTAAAVDAVAEIAAAAF